MPSTTNGAITLYYDWLGPVTGPVVVLLAGAGRPSSDFDAHFCDPLIARGYRLLRVDARDTGRSTALVGTPAALLAVRDAAIGRGHTRPPYAIADMADDVIAVLDDARVESAHVVGRSIGGLIAQQIAIAEPGRAASLTLIMAMSRSMAEHVPDSACERLEGERIADEAEYAARQIAVARANAMAEDFDEARIVAEAGVAWRQGIHAGGTARHFAASLAVPDLRPALARVRLPALILHGRHDRVIPIDRARETAAAIPGARIEVYDDMAHDTPPRLRARLGNRVAEQLDSLSPRTSHM
jgi:pimeloyl-ACP methyl ester carboxylesterase